MYDRYSSPVRCPVHNKTFRFDRPGLPRIHEQYFCEHIWWCNVCVTWCSPDRYCGHVGTKPEWGVTISREQRFYMLVHENNQLKQRISELENKIKELEHTNRE